MASETHATHFFVLEEGVLKSRYDVDVEELEPFHHGEGAHCPRCGGPMGLLPWLPPYRVDLKVHGEELGDFIKSIGYEILLSERFVRAFNAEGLTGLDVLQPADVRHVRHARKRQKPFILQSYFISTARFGRAALDVKLSHIRYSAPPTCDECRYGDKDAIHGFTLEPGTWTGEDIFRPRGLLGTLVVSERFERFLTKHGFTNMRLTPTEEYVWNPLGLQPLSTTRNVSGSSQTH